MANRRNTENFIKNQPAFKSTKPKMPAGKGRKASANSQPAIIPGKLADESQLGGLSSLLISTEIIAREEPKPPLPIPLKKRYRDEIYTTEDVQPLPIVSEKVEDNKTEPVVTPVSEVNEEEEERLKMWRSHILEENNNVKDTRTRACKGQRYREFMWTNYTTRRKANRWELNQDKNDAPPPAKKPKTAKTDNSIDKTSKISNFEENGESSQECAGNSSQLIAEKETKEEKEEEEEELEKENTIQPNGINPPDISESSCFETNISINSHSDCTDNDDYSDCSALAFKSEITNESPPSSDSGEIAKKTENGIVTGSRKRKARRQEIRRLTPGSTLNDILV